MCRRPRAPEAFGDFVENKICIFAILPERFWEVGTCWKSLVVDEV